MTTSSPDDRYLPGPPELPEPLRRRLAPLRRQLHEGNRNQVVPFVGSGLSRGLKAWDELLREIAAVLPEEGRQDLDQQIRMGRFLDVADYLEQHGEVGPGRIQSTIQRFYQTDAAIPELHTLVAALPTAHFLTTNYDPWLKNAVAQQHARVPNVLLPSDKASLANLDSDRAWVFHLHGDADKPESCVLSAKAYRDLLSNNPAWRASVKTLLQSRYLLFLGSSLSEPHLEVLFGEIEAAYHPDGGLRRHWWLGKPNSVIEAVKLRRLGIEPIDYSDHNILPTLLRWLAEPPEAILTRPEPATATTPPGEATSTGNLSPTQPVYDIDKPACNLPSLRGDSPLVGADAALKEVADALRAGSAAIGQTAAVTGLGGIGKTRLALEYAHRSRSDYPGSCFA